MRFNVPHDTTVAEAMDAATELRNRIDPLTGARFTRQSVVYPSIELIPGSPLADSDATRVGVFIFACGLMQYAIIEIAGIKDDYIFIDPTSGGLWITLDDPVVEAFVDYMISGVFMNRFGHVLESLETAYIQIRP
jgi:hypothetical protein